MRLLHSGFDTLDLAFQGALDRDTLRTLELAKAAASDDQEPRLTVLGPGRVQAHVLPAGRRGGYAYVLDTGPLGAIIAVKDSVDSRGWNLFFSLRAMNLAAYGWHGALERLREFLDAAGARVTGHAVNRVDYALDFLAPGFELCPAGFVAHARALKRPHWSLTPREAAESSLPQCVLRGRRVESVTIGKLPGAQVVVYDKRAEALAAGKLAWFALCGLDPKEPVEAWRTELRAGKRELKDRWRLTTLADVETRIGDVFRHMARRVRYLDGRQTDTNVARQRLHPLWYRVTEHVESGAMNWRSGVCPDEVREVERELVATRALRNALGNLATYAVAQGMCDGAIHEELPERLRTLLVHATGAEGGRFMAAVARARDRLALVR